MSEFFTKHPFSPTKFQQLCAEIAIAAVESGQKASVIFHFIEGEGASRPTSSDERCRYAHPVAKVCGDEITVLWLLDGDGGFLGYFYHPNPEALKEKQVEVTAVQQLVTYIRKGG